MMAERSEAPVREAAPDDIFLCTRELPDQLTGETAALRQLCSALAGDGYRVFFPSGLPKDLTDEEKAERIVAALRSAKVMVAAGIGTEGLDDPVSRKLWSEFRRDGTRPFFLCWREQGDAPFPEELAGAEALDMTELTFLVKLKEQLRSLLPPPEIPAGDEGPAETVPEEPVEEDSPAETVPEELVKEDSPAETVPEVLIKEEAPGETTPAAPAKKPFPWKWVLIAAAAALLIWFLFFRK